MNFAIPGLMEMQTPNSDGLPAITKLPRHSLSDTLWTGIAAVGPVLDGEDPMEFAAESAILEFSKTFDNHIVDYTMGTVAVDGQGTVALSDAAEWEFVVPPQELAEIITPGIWYLRFKVTDTEGDVKMIYHYTLPIVP